MPRGEDPDGAAQTVPDRDPDQFDTIYLALPDDQSRLLVETAIESGLRWGELTELRAADLDPASHILTVSRGVVQLNPKFHPTGDRFLVKPYPKSRLSRRFKLSAAVGAWIAAHIEEHGLAAKDLLFTQPEPESRPRLAPVPSDASGLTAPNAKGRSYLHATLSAYTARGVPVRVVPVLAAYRAKRRETGQDGGGVPRPGLSRATGDHLAGDARGPGPTDRPDRAASPAPGRHPGSTYATGQWVVAFTEAGSRQPWPRPD